MSSACDDFLEALLGSEGPLPKEQLSHAVVCESCRALLGPHVLRHEDAPGPNGSLGGVFREEIRADVQRELGVNPTRLPWWAATSALTVLNVFVLILGVAKLGMDNAKLSNLSGARLFAVMALLLICALGGTLVSIMPRGRRARRVMLGLSAAVPFLVLLGGDGQRVYRTLGQALPCCVMEIGLSVLPLAAAVWLLTRAAWQPVRIWLAAASGGAVGLLALELGCLDGSPQHLMAFHLLPWALVCAGAFYARHRLVSKTFAN